MPLGYLDTTPIEQERLNPYVSQYVPVPFEHLFEAGRTVQMRGEKNMEDAQKRLAELEQIKLRPHETDKAVMQGIIQNYQKDRDALLEKGINPASMEFKREASNLINRYTTTPDITQLRQNRELYDRYVAAKDMLQKQGKRTIEFDPRVINAPYAESTNFDPSAVPEEFLDRRGEMEKYFNQMQADGSFTGLSRVQGMPYMIQEGNWKGITSNKIGQQAARNVEGYLNTSTGQQHYRDLIKLQGMTPDQARTRILGEMMGVGMEQQFSQTDADVHQDPWWLMQAKAGLDNEQSQADNHYVTMLSESSMPGGAHMDQEQFGKYTGLAPITDERITKKYGKNVYNVNTNEGNFVIGLSKGKRYGMDVWNRMNNYRQMLGDITGKEIDLANLSSSDPSFKNVMKIWGNAMALWDKDTYDKDFDSRWDLVAEGNEELGPMKEKFRQFEKENPGIVKLFQSDPKYWTSEQAMKDMIAVKALSGNGNMNVRLAPNGNNAQSISGNLWTTMEGVDLVDNLKSKLGEDNYETLLEMGYIKEEKDADGTEYATINGDFRMKDKPTVEKGLRYNTNAYEGSQELGTQQQWNESTRNYMVDQERVAMGKQNFFNGLLKNPQAVYTEVLNDPNFNPQEKAALKKQTESVYDAVQVGDEHMMDMEYSKLQQMITEYGAAE